jgi:hypothetical protein
MQQVRWYALRFAVPKDHHARMRLAAKHGCTAMQPYVPINCLLAACPMCFVGMQDRDVSCYSANPTSIRLCYAPQSSLLASLAEHVRTQCVFLSVFQRAATSS